MKKNNFLILLLGLFAFFAQDISGKNTANGPIKPVNNIGDKEIVFLSWLNSNTWPNETALKA